MENSYLLIAIVLGVVLISLLIWLVIIKKKYGRKTSYRAFFIIGICWIPLGIAIENYAFTVLGAVFLILGITHRNQWKEEGRWSDLSPMERRIKIIVSSVLALILFIGLIAYLIIK